MNDARAARGQIEAYWQARRNLLYYHVVRVLVEGLSDGARSILDVGSGGCPYLDWFPNIGERVSLDRRLPYEGPGVTPVRADFLDWTPDRLFDIVTCLQVLEHVSRADLFAQRLLSAGKIVVVSVPYKWAPDATGSYTSHVHDPVDEEKMKLWFAREPNFQYVCREAERPSRRLIQVYERHGSRWKDLRSRAWKEAAGWPQDMASPAPAPAVPAQVRWWPPERAALRGRMWLSRQLKRAAARIAP